MQSRAIPSASLLDGYIQLFADTIAEEFEIPAREALRQINCELAGNPMTRIIRLRLREFAQELQVRPTDTELVA